MAIRSNFNFLSNYLIFTFLIVSKTIFSLIIYFSLNTETLWLVWEGKGG